MSVTIWRGRFTDAPMRDTGRCSLPSLSELSKGPERTPSSSFLPVRVLPPAGRLHGAT